MPGVLDFFLGVLGQAREELASDLLFSPGEPPMARIGGVYRRLKDFPVLSVEDVWAVMEVVLPEPVYKNARHRADKSRIPEEIQVSFTGHYSRYRVQVFWVVREKGEGSEELVAPVVALRLIPKEVWSFRDLGLPEELLAFTRYDVGLVLVAGPTDSGKTTTLAALTEYLNSHYTRHILTVERPVEYLIASRQSVVHQREVGVHVASVSQAIHTALRSNVDVIVVGEARTGEEYRAVLEAAETGHLVFASMHAPGVIEALERIVGAAAANGDQALVRQILGNVLLGVIVQRLIPSGGNWRQLAYELLVVDRDARGYIKSGEFEKLYTYMEHRRNGSITLEQNVASLVKTGKVPPDLARFYVNREEVFNSHLMRR